MFNKCYLKEPVPETSKFPQKYYFVKSTQLLQVPSKVTLKRTQFKKCNVSFSKNYRNLFASKSLLALGLVSAHPLTPLHTPLPHPKTQDCHRHFALGLKLTFDQTDFLRPFIDQKINDDVEKYFFYKVKFVLKIKKFTWLPKNYFTKKSKLKPFIHPLLSTYIKEEKTRK